MLEFGIATVLLIGTILIGFPIAFSIGITTVIYILMTNPANISAIPIRMFSGINSFTLMALPLFMLAAEIMIRTGISSKLFDFVRITRFGKKRGGLAYVNILVSTIFGSISGAALSDIAGLGAVELQAMDEDGYDKGFSCAVTAASSIQSPLIPPSNVAILYAGTMALSVGAVLYAGLIPGLLLAFGEMAYVKLNSKKFPMHEKEYTKEEKKDIRKRGLIAMGMPLIILIGITAGIVTPTEAAAVAVLYALIVGIFVFHNLTLEMVISSLKAAGKTTANLFIITSLSAVFAWAIGVENIPAQLTAFMMSVTESKYVMLLIINLIFLIVGMWMETSAAILLFVPILAPMVTTMGVHPVHFAVIVILNLTVGLITPPVGVVLYAVANVGKEKFETVVKSTMPFILMGFALVLLLTYVPEFCLFLPRIMGFL
ncbi:Neu5Ac permease [uncultured Clostridium sp.]|uniref:TRAP transporter large permease n=1 Tax=Muricoprocola aceti TaxID=2981772 RepID=A0ABT2SIU0_9FIRM|nr:TRAP transporter large permease [Muricoprocola aceti]MCU6724420.1 TRAP transporter large permease [Muricoprocola aceti]SCH11980.1 Neu5Ac permease [uncultured Clostridium sp.]